jgi:hypothetical protein
VVGHFSCLILSDSYSKPHKFLIFCGATSFTSKNSATISPRFHFKRKLPGAFGKPTKNAPAIANVRVPEVRRKKKFSKKCRVGLLTVVVQRPAQK